MKGISIQSYLTEKRTYIARELNGPNVACKVSQ